MVKQFSKWLLTGALVSVLLPSAYAAAGSEGHGGGGWVCRSANDSITWVKFVDLFEARNQYGLTLDSFVNLPIDQQLSAVEKKINLSNSEIVPAYEANLEGIKENLVVSSEIAIIRIPDADFSVKPAKELCPGGKIDYEQVANYTDDGNVIFAKLLYDKLSTAEKAALFVHEAVYKLYRDKFGATDSDLARKAVAYLFSNKSVAQYPEPFFGNPVGSFEALVLKNISMTKSWKLGMKVFDDITNNNIVTGNLDFRYMFAHFDSSGAQNVFYENYLKDYKNFLVVASDSPSNTSVAVDTGVITATLIPSSDLSSLDLSVRWQDTRTQAVITADFTYVCRKTDGLSTITDANRFVICDRTKASLQGVTLDSLEQLDMDARTKALAIQFDTKQNKVIAVAQTGNNLSDAASSESWYDLTTTLGDWYWLVPNP